MIQITSHLLNFEMATFHYTLIISATY